MVIRYPNATGRSPRMSDQAKLPADCGERVEGILQVVPRVGRSHDGPHARLVPRNGRKRDPLRKHAALEELVRELHGSCAFAHDHGRDWTLAQAGVEPQALQPLFEETSVLPQTFND